jgi:CubicO group peptidase (beta-lactamase class C family)
MSAMLRLVDKGTVSLDTNVNRYLRSWKLPENEFTKQEPVTLRRLATHTAGTTLAGFPGHKVGLPLPTVPDLLDGKAPANTEPVRVDQLPGQGFRYSGGGTTIMGLVMTDATGTPLSALLQQQVLGPLGMAHSIYEMPLAEARAAAAARGHEKNAVVPGGWHVYPEAAGGLWTTPTDLATWAIAMGDALSGRSTTFLSQATASQIIASAVPGRSVQERIGLGLLLYGTGDTLNFVHNGQNEGFISEFKMYANRGQGVAIMINTGESGFTLVREIQYAIAAEFGWPDLGTAKVTTVAVDAAALDRLTGTYVIDIKSGRHLPRVVREGTRLFFEGWGLSAREELYPQSPTTFIGAAAGTKFTFTRDAAGRDLITMGEGPRAVTGFKQQ